MNNSVYGKTMENMRNRIKLRVTTNEKGFLKYAPKPTFISPKISGEDFIVFHEKKESIKLNKAKYVGASV